MYFDRKMAMKRKTLFSEYSQSLVELAIAFTVMMFLLSGIIEFGIAFFQYMQIRDAAQEGAIYGSVNPTDETGIRNRIADVINRPFNLGITPTSSNITISDHGGRCAGYGLVVTITYDHPVTMPLIASITGSTIRLRGSAVSTILTPPCSP
jgi:Flp pilus assembly protein TadG